MSCACEHIKMSSQYERMRRLAKVTAGIHGQTVALYQNEDGTYDFTTDTEIDKSIVEFISPY